VLARHSTDAIVIGAGISGFYQLYKLRELGQRRASTANGIARMAPVTLREVRIDQLSYDAPAAVIENLNITLLGMSFLGLIAGLRDARHQTSRSAE
jgi:predicted aspartyl protease